MGWRVLERHILGHSDGSGRQANKYVHSIFRWTNGLPAGLASKPRSKPPALSEARVSADGLKSSPGARNTAVLDLLRNVVTNRPRRIRAPLLFSHSPIRTLRRLY